MTDITIPPGAYKLARDVQNPSPDRRYSRDWRKMPVWDKGTQFVVREQRRMGDRHLAEVTAGLEPDVVAELLARDRYTVVELAGDHHASLHRIGPGDDEQYAALAGALVAVEETLAQFMTRIDCESGFTEWLLENGKISRADLERWWHSYQYGDDESVVEPPAIITLQEPDDEPITHYRDAGPTSLPCDKLHEHPTPKSDPGLDPDRGHGGYDWSAYNEITHPGAGEDD